MGSCRALRFSSSAIFTCYMFALLFPFFAALCFCADPNAPLVMDSAVPAPGGPSVDRGGAAVAASPQEKKVDKNGEDDEGAANLPSTTPSQQQTHSRSLTDALVRASAFANLATLAEGLHAAVRPHLHRSAEDAVCEVGLRGHRIAG